MDVKFEGENVVRHLDMTTHNHASPLTNTPPWTYIDSPAAPPSDHPCKNEIIKMQNACKDPTFVQKGKRTHRECKEGCEEKMACILVPKGKDKELCCSPRNTGHHMIEDHWVKSNPNFSDDQKSYNKAPTVCANRFRKRGSRHRRLHNIQGTIEESFMPGGSRYKSGEKNGGFNYGAGKKAALIAHHEVFKDSGCTPECLESQLDDHYGEGQDDRPLNKPSKQALGKDIRSKLKPDYAVKKDWFLSPTK
jgi:hypothetical protein